MRLTLMTDYALRLLLFVAQRPERLCTIAEVAQAHAISEAHLMKVTHELARQGWLVTVRGKGGGMRLAREPEQINLAEVVEHCEESIAVIDCLAEGYTGDCPLMPRCTLRSVLRGAQRAFLDHLAAFSLQDLVQSRQMQQAILPPAARPPRRRAARGSK